MGDVSKNISKGGELINLSEVVRLAADKKSIVLQSTHGWVSLRPAAFIINWTIKEIVKFKLFYAIHDKDIAEVEFEEI